MPIFDITLEPYTISPVIRKIHTTTRAIKASSLQEATKLVKEAFTNDADWRVIDITEREAIAKAKGDGA